MVILVSPTAAPRHEHVIGSIVPDRAPADKVHVVDGEASPSIVVAVRMFILVFDFGTGVFACVFYCFTSKP